MVADVRESPREEGEPTATVLRNEGYEAVRVHCDVTREADVAADHLAELAEIARRHGVPGTAWIATG